MSPTHTAWRQVPGLAAVMLLGTACLQPPDASGGVPFGLGGLFDGASTSYTVGGTATGVPPHGLSLTDNADSTVIVASGNYLFPGRLQSGATYHVEVAEQPPTLFCSVSNHAGTVASSDVSNVDVSCACALHLGDCNGTLADGCETNVASSNLNCGACNHACAGGETCQSGTCSAPVLYRPVGLAGGVAESTVTGGGWEACIVGGFGSTTPQQDLLEHCSKAHIMVACRPAGSAQLTWLAWTSREVALAADAWSISSNGATWTSSFGQYMEATDGTNFIWWGYAWDTTDPDDPELVLADGGCGPDDISTDDWEFVVYQAD